MSKSKEISSGEVVSSVKLATSIASVELMGVILLPFISSIPVSVIDRYVVSSEIASVKSLLISSESVFEKVRFSIVESCMVKFPPVNV